MFTYVHGYILITLISCQAGAIIGRNTGHCNGRLLPVWSAGRAPGDNDDDDEHGSGGVGGRDGGAGGGDGGARDCDRLALVNAGLVKSNVRLRYIHTSA